MEERNYEEAILDFVMVLKRSPQNMKKADILLSLREALLSNPRFMDLPRGESLEFLTIIQVRSDSD